MYLLSYYYQGNNASCLLGLDQRQLHGGVLLPDPLSGDLHVLRCRDPQDPRGVQRVQVHRVLHVHHVHHLAGIHTHLLQHGAACPAQDHVHGHYNKVGSFQDCTVSRVKIELDCGVIGFSPYLKQHLKYGISFYHTIQMTIFSCLAHLQINEMDE